MSLTRADLNSAACRAANEPFLGGWGPRCRLASTTSPTVHMAQGHAPQKVYSIDDLERIFGSGTFSAETALLLQQIQDANRRVTETLNRSNAYRKLSDRIRSQIDKLRKYKGLINDHGDKKSTIKTLAGAANKTVEEVRADLQELDFKLTDNGTVVTQPQDALYSEKVVTRTTNENDFDAFENPRTKTEVEANVTADKLDLEIKRLEGEIHRIDGLRESEGLRTQELLQLKQRLVTLATNILQTTHKSLEAITNNTRA